MDFHARLLGRTLRVRRAYFSIKFCCKALVHYDWPVRKIVMQYVSLRLWDSIKPKRASVFALPMIMMRRLAETQWLKSAEERKLQLIPLPCMFKDIAPGA